MQIAKILFIISLAMMAAIPLLEYFVEDRSVQPTRTVADRSAFDKPVKPVRPNPNYSSDLVEKERADKILSAEMDEIQMMGIGMFNAMQSLQSRTTKERCQNFCKGECATSVYVVGSRVACYHTCTAKRCREKRCPERIGGRC